MKIEVVKKIQGMEKIQLWLKFIGWLCVILAIIGMFLLGFKSYVIALYLAGIILLIIQLWYRVKEYKYIKEINAKEKGFGHNKQSEEKPKKKHKKRKILA